MKNKDKSSFDKTEKIINKKIKSGAIVLNSRYPIILFEPGPQNFCFYDTDLPIRGKGLTIQDLIHGEKEFYYKYELYKYPKFCDELIRIIGNLNDTISFISEQYQRMLNEKENDSWGESILSE